LLASGGLKPDAFAAGPLGAARIIAPTPTTPTRPATRTPAPRVLPLQLRPAVSVTRPAVASPPPVHSSPSPRASVAAPKHAVSARAQARKHPRVAVQSRPAPARLPAPFLSALVARLGLPSLGTAVRGAAATVEAPGRDRGPTFFAALAFLALTAASGSFVSLAYRLHRARIEV